MYDNEKRAAPKNMDFTKLDRVNYAFFQTDLGGNIWGMDSYTNKYMKLHTYGGKLTENIVQAISRDLLVYSMFTVERAGYPVVMHIHDEIVCEVPLIRDKKLEEFEADHDDYSSILL